MHFAAAASRGARRGSAAAIRWIEQLDGGRTNLRESLIAGVVTNAASRGSASATDLIALVEDAQLRRAVEQATARAPKSEPREGAHDPVSEAPR